jgi:tetratricopeptide (TPR) repeat protein
MAKTFQDRLKAKQEAKFIGRSEHLTHFKNNLKAEDPCAIFNIYGQGGVGKTYLSRQYKTFADLSKCLTAYTDEDTKSILQWMDGVALQFKNQDAELVEFDKNYKTYQQETKKLETDPEKPKGTFGGIMKTLTKGAIKEAKKLPGADLIGSFLDEDGIAGAFGEWADFARKKIGNKDEVELVLEPLKVLTPLFWKGVTKHAADKKFVCFFIDTFEETDKVLETWLLDLLEGKYGDIPSNILLIIAGRDPLSINRWSAFTDLTQTIPLEPFTEPETEAYFEAQGIEDKAIKADIIHLSGRLPVLMAWLTEAAKSSKGGVHDACETAVERFLKWVVEDNQRTVSLAAALPRKLNQDIIECFLTDKAQSKAYFDWLCKQPFVLRKGDYWAYHNVVRDQMMRYVRTRSPKEWVNQHQALSDYFESLQTSLELEPEAAFVHKVWLDHEQDRLYHALCAKPDKNLPVAIRFVVKKWASSDGKGSSVLGETLFEAGKDSDHDILLGWGLRIKTAFEEVLLKNYIPIQQLISDILQKDFIKTSKPLAFLHYMNGLIFNVKGDKDKGIECYEKAIAIKPDYHETFYIMGLAYDDKGDKDKAIECYEKVIAIKPNFYEAFYHMGIAYKDKDEYEKAINCYEKAIEIKPDYYEAFYILGLLYYAKDEYKKAIDCYEKAIEIKPDYHEIFYILGFLYSDKGDEDKAIDCYEKAIAIKPDYYEAFYGMGYVYSDKGDEDKAIDCYEKAIAIKPDYHEAFYNMGNVYSDKGDEDKAIDCYQRAILIKPDFYEAFFCMGNAYNGKGDTDKAIECYEKAIAIKSDYHEAFNNIGLAYNGKGDTDKAIECYEKAIAIKSDYHEVFNNIGLAYDDKGDTDKAIECYEKAIAIKPDEHESFYNMGLAYSNKGEKDKAIEYYQKAITIKPDDHEVFYNMGNEYDDKGDTDKAIECYEKAIVIKPDYHEAFYNMGFVYDDKGDTDKAIECYQKVIAIKTDEHEAFSNMGSAYSDKGDTVNAH